MSTIQPYRNDDLNEDTPMVSGVAKVWDVNVSEALYASIQVNAESRSTPTFAAAINVLASDDGDNFVALSGTTAAPFGHNISGTTSRLYRIDPPNFKYARVAYTPVAGSGILEVWTHLKGIE